MCVYAYKQYVYTCGLYMCVYTSIYTYTYIMYIGIYVCVCIYYRYININAWQGLITYKVNLSNINTPIKSIRCPDEHVPLTIYALSERFLR